MRPGPVGEGSHLRPIYIIWSIQAEAKIYLLYPGSARCITIMRFLKKQISLCRQPPGEPTNIVEKIDWNPCLLIIIRFISSYDFNKPWPFFSPFVNTRATAPLVRGIAEQCGELDYGVGGIQSYPSITFITRPISLIINIHCRRWRLIELGLATGHNIT